MNVSRGVVGMTVPTYNADQVISQCISTAKERKIVKAG